MLTNNKKYIIINISNERKVMLMTKAEYRKLKKQLYDYEELLRKEECEKEYLNMLPFENKYF